MQQLPVKRRTTRKKGQVRLPA